MRVWLLIGALAVIVGVTLAVRTRGGWEPTELERLDILCDRGSAANCTLLGLRLLESNPGPEDTERGLEKLSRGCNLGDSTGCFLQGSKTLALGGSAVVAALAFGKGCKLRHQDSCAYSGWLKRHAPIAQRDLDGGRTLLLSSCGNGSALGCTWLGEIALDGPSSPSDRASASKSFEKGCELGNDWSCLRAAQAWACGRGVEENRKAAIQLFTKTCDHGIKAACDQLLALDPDGELVVDDDTIEIAVMQAAFSFAQLDDREHARRFAEALQGDRELLARAAVAIAFEDLAMAETLLAELPLDGGVANVEVQVARETLAAVKEGNAFPEAAWIGWGRAGRPDLRKPRLVPRWSDDDFDRGWCRPAEPTSMDTPDGFLKAVAVANERSILDGPFDQDFVRAAMRYSSSPSLPVRLTALAVLKQVAASKSDDATAEFEAAARRAFAAEHDGTRFFALVKLPSDLHGAATEAELEIVEHALTLPADLPRREVFDAFAQALGPGWRSGERAFSATVFALSLVDEYLMPEWLERGGLDPQRRARVLRALGERMVEDEWLVNRYGGVRVLKAANALAPDEALGRTIESVTSQLQRLRTGPTGYHAMGLWPWHQQTSHPEVQIEFEVREAERLDALAAGKKP